MKKIKGVSLVLENCEMICLKRSEFRDLKIEDITQSVIQIGEDLLEIDTLSYVYVTLNAAANHTYNSFGTASKQTIFDRLTSIDQPISVVMLQYDDDTYRDLFLSEDTVQEFAPNEYGDLTIECFKEEDLTELFCGEDDPDC